MAVIFGSPLLAMTKSGSWLQEYSPGVFFSYSKKKMESFGTRKLRNCHKKPNTENGIE
jgi:hypothetical protein